jgi:CTP synthase
MPGSSLVIHLTLVPFLSASGELKTKPTQHSVKLLLENGIQPDILVLRTEHQLTTDIREKVARFCNVGIESVIQSIDVKTIYEVPLLMSEEKLDVQVLQKLKLEVNEKPALKEWKAFLDRMQNAKKTVNVALVGKYIELQDSYKSIVESFVHAGAQNQAKVIVKWVDAETINSQTVNEILDSVNGILIAPGFGHRGIEGKILAAHYAREKFIPFFGICLGMQCAVIEFARNVLHFENANSTEMIANTPFPVIDLMEGQKSIIEMGGTMRLGSYPCNLKPGSLVEKIYKKELINERHRHRYEFNNHYLKDFEEHGMLATGVNPDSELVEIIEIPSHPWFVGVQFHPEYKSTVVNPHPLFVDFIKASLLNKSKK